MPICVAPAVEAGGCPRRRDVRMEPNSVYPINVGLFFLEFIHVIFKVPGKQIFKSE